VLQVSVTTWQPRVTQVAEPGVFEAFKSKALVGQGPNLLLSSSDGVYNLARCGALQPLLLDPAFVAAALPGAVESVSWNGTVWGLPVALTTSSVLYYNRLLAPAGPSPDLLQFAAQASDCSLRMALNTTAAALAGFFVTPPLLTGCSNTAALRAVFDLLNGVARSPCGAASEADFGAGLAAFLNGPSSDLGRWERRLGANLGVASLPKLSFDGSTLDSRR
jgi:maltose-binding protein MalE